MDYGFRTSIPDDAHDEFYAELSRQILLLTDEDDEVQVMKRKGGRRRFNQRSVVSLLPGNYFLSWSEGGAVEVPGWMERLWAASGGGNGTGVFIPRAGGVQRSRKRCNKSMKNNGSDRAKAHIRLEDLGSS